MEKLNKATLLPYNTDYNSRRDLLRDFYDNKYFLVEGTTTIINAQSFNHNATITFRLKRKTRTFQHSSTY